MISLEQLNHLMEASIKDSRTEPEFFRALLNATLYAHAPLNDDSERLRLVMFTSPADHALTVPVFTDKAKAEFAARGKVRIVSMPGQLLFEITQGASLTINPNDNWCTLYPEEISELLATGTVAPTQIRLSERRGMRVIFQNGVETMIEFMVSETPAKNTISAKHTGGSHDLSLSLAIASFALPATGES